jgi:hypothetical protein
MKEYFVTQTVYFTWRVTAESPEEAENLASQLDYDSAWESYAEPVEPNNIVLVDEDLL